MKKYLLSILLIILALTITGCGNKEKKPEEVPENLQGLYQGSKYSSSAAKLTGTNLIYYYVYKIEGTTVKRKICLIGTGPGLNKTIEDCDFDDGKTGLFATTTLDIKEIEYTYDNENVTFNIYDGETLYAKCKTSFGSASCTANDGTNLSWSKKK